tara:strand:+ start:1488 stop:2450 length:963 start_codon:yes stop_codon:yes gene_type:complete
MYHYIRNNEEFEYDVFCRTKSEFIDQVKFLINNFKPCSLNDKDEIEYFLKSEEQSFILSFDDGYKDHLFCTEFLNKMGISGLFFPSDNIFKSQFLDVNLIHLILGKRNNNINEILNSIQNLIYTYKLEIYSPFFKYYGSSIDEYIQKVQPKRFQDLETSSIKYLLQRDIKGSKNRRLILDQLFLKNYEYDYKKFVDDFYLSLEDIKKMKLLGAKFGSHTISHTHLNSLIKAEQKNEIINSFRYLDDLNVIAKDDLKILSYPYGAYNKDTLNILENSNVDFAVTCDAKKAILNKENSPYTLARWNTNDWWDKNSKKPISPI